MHKLKYDDTNKYSIIAYAKELEGKTLRDFVIGDVVVYGGKGKFGQYLEKIYFQKDLDSESQPDFPKAGIELKSSPLKIGTKKQIRVKERLVMNIIDYNKLVGQYFNTSDFFRKNEDLLIVFYLYDKESDPLDLTVKAIGEWHFKPDSIDYEIIKRDWELIQSKVKQGLAHELSEGDTLYLGACTKGANARSMRTQPFSSLQAKQRAFSLKTGYVNHILAKITHSKDDKLGKLITSLSTIKKQSLEDIVISRLQPYYGQSYEKLCEQFWPEGIHSKAKNRFRYLINLLLGIQIGSEVEEFEKANIVLKVTRLTENNTPKESTSFPAFQYVDLVEEQVWEDSEIYSFLEQKFLFIFFKIQNEILYLKKAIFYTIPQSDLDIAKEIWESTKEVIGSGNIVSGFQKNGSRTTNFPGAKLKKVIHARPHGSNSQDVFLLPTPDKLTGEKYYTKYSFWLNNTYISENVYEKNVE